LFSLEIKKSSARLKLINFGRGFIVSIANLEKLSRVEMWIIKIKYNIKKTYE